MILGSGFVGVADSMDTRAAVPYARLPGFPRTSVGGHAGQALLGTLRGTPVLVLSGRAHYYEGHAMEQVTYPVRVLASYGIRSLLVTNAAGGINPQFHSGDFMLIRDHINLMGANPLRGAGPRDDARFVDMSGAYDSELGRLLETAAKETGILLRAGVYLAVSGPSYETPAEIRAFARLEADAVGMSTVPEVIVARRCGLAVAGLSCITNPGAGRSPERLSHAAVLAEAGRVQEKASQLLGAFSALYGLTR
jgi:purine-nucleoside phosphorylase